jgi:hypothetical protein
VHRGFSHYSIEENQLSERDLVLRKVYLVCCAQITCLVRSDLCGSVPIIILKKTNKEEEELVDVAPHWGEPCISFVDVLCARLFMLFMYLFA